MRAFYFIMAHWHERQLRRLLDAVWDPRDVFLLHIDERAAPSLHQFARAAADGKANVRILPSRKVAWGGFSLVQAELDAIAVAVGSSDPWDVFINLSGQDYPLTSRDRRAARLSAEPSRNFVELISLHDQPAAIRARAATRHVDSGGRVIDTGEPLPPPDGFRAEWRGGAWHGLRRPFCEWLLRDPSVQRMKDWFCQVMLPEESFLQSAIMNSPFADTVYPRHLRKMIWKNAEAAHPETLTLANAEELLSSDALFARKFDEDVDADILDLLRRAISA
jgi:hypothetical protein